MNKLKVCLLQQDIKWLDVEANISHLSLLFSNVDKDTDLLVLPEMCTSGFSMKEKKQISDNLSLAIKFFSSQAKIKSICIITSMITNENDSYYNRLYVFDRGERVLSYDKRHLFSMANEDKYFKAGLEKLIFNLKGFNICPIVCYDLRFPVWIRNINNNYDILICIANWPKARIQAWEILLKARALENQCFVLGVNRVGTDGSGLNYNGASQIIDAKGRVLAIAKENTEEFIYSQLSFSELNSFREKFPAFNDADDFKII